jgi:hypothetical protein
VQVRPPTSGRFTVFQLYQSKWGLNKLKMKIRDGVFILILFSIISLLVIKYGFGQQDKPTTNYAYTTSEEINIKEHEKRIYAVEEEIVYLKSRIELYADIINDLIKENNDLKYRMYKLDKKKK